MIIYRSRLFPDENEHYHSMKTPEICVETNEFIFRCERALQSPSYEGTIEEFCREKGHGYIRPRDNPTQLIFAHVSE